METELNQINRHYWATKQDGIEYLVFYAKTNTGDINVMWSNKTATFKSYITTEKFLKETLKVYPVKQFTHRGN